MAGEERARVAVDKPLTSLRVAVEAEPGCVFHLTLDDMTVVAN